MDVRGRINTYCMTDHWMLKVGTRTPTWIESRKLTFSVYMKYAYKRMSGVKHEPRFGALS